MTLCVLNVLCIGAISLLYVFLGESVIDKCDFQLSSIFLGVVLLLVYHDISWLYVVVYITN